MIGISFQPLYIITWGANRMLEKRTKTPMEYLNIGEFNRGQSSKVIKGISENDKAAYILKNGKPIAVIMSYTKYEHL